jgi:Zn finger protein HypA/HybF involved in hydrogenase expression
MEIINNKNEIISFKLKDEIIINGQLNKIKFICYKCKKEEIIQLRQIIRRNIILKQDTDLLCTSCYQKEHFKELYGVENPGQLEKTKKINSERDYTKQAIKTKKTCLEKYGAEKILSVPSIREKIKKTCLEKYGVESLLFLPEIRSKNPISKLEIREKIKKTCLEKYGVESVSQVKSILNKRRLTRFRNNSLRFNTNFYELLNEYNGVYLRKENCIEYLKYNFKCKKCNTVFESGIYNEPSCPICNPKPISSGEEEVYEFLKSLNVSIIKNDRSILNGKEIDFLINNLGIEYDGLYWHSEEKGAYSTYHLEKTEEALLKKINLIHIFEDEWIYKKNIVKSIIKNKLGIIENKYYARNLELKNINNKMAFTFFERNHIQGGSYGNINYGLFNNEEMIFCISFTKSRFNRKYNYEILRMASKLNSIIVGGFEKCLKHFKEIYKGNIITYVDRRYFNGNSYIRCGFEFSHNSNPNYYYFKDQKRFSRIKFQKHKLNNLLENFDPSLTEKENMKINGWNWIYDCGNSVFVN